MPELDAQRTGDAELSEIVEEFSAAASEFNRVWQALLDSGYKVEVDIIECSTIGNNPGGLISTAIYKRLDL